jgi:hypothetical protein
MTNMALLQWYTTAGTAPTAAAGRDYNSLTSLKRDAGTRRTVVVIGSILKQEHLVPVWEKPSVLRLNKYIVH